MYHDCTTLISSGSSARTDSTYIEFKSASQASSINTTLSTPRRPCTHDHHDSRNDLKVKRMLRSKHPFHTLILLIPISDVLTWVLKRYILHSLVLHKKWCSETSLMVREKLWNQTSPRDLNSQKIHRDRRSFPFYSLQKENIQISVCIETLFF